MTYFQFNVSNPYTGMSLQLSPSNTSADLAIYVRRFLRPNAFTGEFDHVFELKKLKSYNREFLRKTNYHWQISLDAFALL